MGSRRHTHNKDHFNIRGSTPGPAGPLGQFKRQLATKKAVLSRDQEHVIPSERPVAGRSRKAQPEEEES